MYCEKVVQSNDCVTNKRIFDFRFNSTATFFLHTSWQFSSPLLCYDYETFPFELQPFYATRRNDLREARDHSNRVNDKIYAPYDGNEIASPISISSILFIASAPTIANLPRSIAKFRPPPFRHFNNARCLGLVRKILYSDPERYLKFISFAKVLFSVELTWIFDYSRNIQRDRVLERAQETMEVQLA